MINLKLISMAVSIYKMGSENTLNAGQYVAEVLDFSSQYGTYDPAKYSYKVKFFFTKLADLKWPHTYKNTAIDRNYPLQILQFSARELQIFCSCRQFLTG